MPLLGLPCSNWRASLYTAVYSSRPLSPQWGHPPPVWEASPCSPSCLSSLPSGHRSHHTSYSGTNCSGIWIKKSNQYSYTSTTPRLVTLLGVVAPHLPLVPSAEGWNALPLLRQAISPFLSLKYKPYKFSPLRLPMRHHLFIALISLYVCATIS